MTPAQNIECFAPAVSRPRQLICSILSLQALLEDEKYAEGLAALERTALDSPWLLNAAGVFHLRLGNLPRAIELFRLLAVEDSGAGLRKESPCVFITNYATALILSGNLDAGLSVLRELGEAASETGFRLYQAIDDWIEQLSPWQKLNWYLGGMPSAPLDLGFPPGDLE